MLRGHLPEREPAASWTTRRPGSSRWHVQLPGWEIHRSAAGSAPANLSLKPGEWLRRFDFARVVNLPVPSGADPAFPF